MKGYQLYIIAKIFQFFLKPIGFIWGLIRSKNRDKYLENIAQGIDQHANVWGHYMWNNLWVEPEVYSAGNKDETITRYSTYQYVLIVLDIN